MCRARRAVPCAKVSRAWWARRSVVYKVIRVTFEDEAAVPFDLSNGKMDADILSDNDQLFQDLWRTYFKAICIKERMNPKKQLSDMPRRYWKYMTEKNG